MKGNGANEMTNGPKQVSQVTVLVKKILAVDWISAVVALILLFAIIGAVHPQFVSPTQIINVLQQSVYGAILAAGVAFLMTQGEIDLSVGGNYVLTMVVGSLLIQQGFNTWVAAGLALLVAVLVGAINAFIIQVIKIPGLIATLGMGWVLHGMASALTGGRAVIGMPVTDSFFDILGGRTILGVPVAIWFLVVLIGILTVVLRYTPFGYRVRQIGSNLDAARFAGIPIGRTKTTAFLLCGLLAGVAGLLGLAYFTTGDPTAGSGLELFSAAGAVIGGNPLMGGTATIFGAGLGATLLNAVSIGLVYFNIPAIWSQFATGIVIIVAVSLDGLMRSRKNQIH